MTLVSSLLMFQYTQNQICVSEDCCARGDLSRLSSRKIQPTVDPNIIMGSNPSEKPRKKPSTIASGLQNDEHNVDFTMIVFFVTLLSQIQSMLSHCWRVDGSHPTVTPLTWPISLWPESGGSGQPLMGNVHSGSALTRTTVALDSFVGELGGDIIFEKRWGVCRPLLSHLKT